MTATHTAPAAQQQACRWLSPVCLVLGIVLGSYLTRESDTQAPSPPTSGVDIGFLHYMIIHHEQAIELARISVANAGDLTVRTLAFDILTGQGTQIGMMQGWLDMWGQPRKPAEPYTSWMAEGDHQMPSHDSGTSMPGMATALDFETFRAAEGHESDTQFLKLMLRHHQGGNDMLEVASDRAEDPIIRRFARSLLALQQHESDVMTTMLAQRNEQPLPFP